MRPRIRKIREEDISCCQKIILETKASHSSREVKKLLQLSIKRGIGLLNPEYYVLALGKDIIGISGLYYDYEDPGDVMWMDYFAVSKKFQNKGYGKMMLKNLETICKKKKIRMLCVFTYNKAKKAIGFYKHNGFRICGKINNYYKKGESRIWLYKKI